ncbi:MAG: hypothetical protein AVDCRST_MAG28-4239, partial [uncultured Rubrobacteraceae bacterium]
ARTGYRSAYHVPGDARAHHSNNLYHRVLLCERFYLRLMRNYGTLRGCGAASPCGCI